MCLICLLVNKQQRAALQYRKYQYLLKQNLKIWQFELNDRRDQRWKVNCPQIVFPVNTIHPMKDDCGVISDSVLSPSVVDIVSGG